MATKYFIPGGTNTITANANWSLSSGGPNNTTVPTAADEAIFDAGSGTGTVIGGNLSVLNWNMKDFAGTFSWPISSQIRVWGGGADAFHLGPAMTLVYGVSGVSISFDNPSGVAVITSNGKKLPPFSCNGAGTVQFGDDITCDHFANSVISLTVGTLDGNGKNVLAGGVSHSGTSVKTLSLGGGTWTVGSNVTSGTHQLWNMGGTNATFNKGTSNIVFLAPASGRATMALGTPSTAYNYNDITFNDASSPVLLVISGAQQCQNFVVGRGWNMQYSGANTATVRNNLTITGTEALPCGWMCSGGSSNFTYIVLGTASSDYTVLFNTVISSPNAAPATNAVLLGGAQNWKPTSNLKTAYDDDLTDAILDGAAGIETGFTVKQGLRLVASALFGKSAVAGSTHTFRDMADSKDRITATVTSGDRTAVTRDAA